MLALLALTGCATTSAQFKPIGNCVTSSTVGTFSCVSSTGAAPPLTWDKASGLICFDYLEFKEHEEVCHTP